MLENKIKMKKYLLLVLLFGVTLSANAQSNNYQDVVYLKNGSVIKGTIVEQILNVSIKIETRDGNLFVYKMDEIEKLTKEISRYRNSAGNRNFGQSQFNKPQGYMGLIEVGGGIGIGAWAADRVSLTMVNGYRIIPQFAIGIGVGAEMFFYEPISRTVSSYSPEISLPIFLHLRSDFIEGQVSPFVTFNVGYNLSLGGGYFDGILLEPTLGVSYNVGQRNRMTAGVSFMMNRVKYAVYWGSYSEYTDMGNALKLKVGFSF
jgi:hypothetical protein